MSLTLTGTGGVFTVFGPAFNAMDALNTAKEHIEAARVDVIGPVDHHIFKSIYFCRT